MYNNITIYDRGPLLYTDGLNDTSVIYVQTHFNAQIT